VLRKISKRKRGIARTEAPTNEEKLHVCRSLCDLYEGIEKIAVSFGNVVSTKRAHNEV
jgi:hypothetical protein